MIARVLVFWSSGKKAIRCMRLLVLWMRSVKVVLVVRAVVLVRAPMSLVCSISLMLQFGICQMCFCSFRLSVARRQKLAA